MWRNPILHALAKAVQAGSGHAAHQALRGTDPLVAWWLHRRLFAAEQWASLSVEDSTDRVHVLRLAFLKEAGRLDDVSMEDRDAVKQVFEEVASGLKRPGKMWWVSLGAVFVVLGVLAVVLFPSWQRWTAFDARATPVGRALGAELTDYGVFVTKHRVALLTEEDPPARYLVPLGKALESVDAGVGAEARESLHELLNTHSRAALDRSGGAEILDDLYTALHHFNGILRDTRQPYLMDLVYDRSAGPLLISYYVAKERSANVAGTEVRVVRGYRLDTLKRALRLSENTIPRVGVAIVNMDVLELEFVSLIAPALVESRAALIVDEATRDDEPAWIPEVENRMGQVLRRDMQPFRDSDADHVIALLGRRTELYDSISRKALAAGKDFQRPTRLVWTSSTNELEGLVTSSELREWGTMENELHSDRASVGFGVAIEPFADLTAHRELQRQVNFRQGLAVFPTALRELLGMEQDVEVRPWSYPDLVRGELSALLATVASSPRQAATALSIAACAIFAKNLWHTPHAAAMAVVLASLQEELGGEAGLVLRKGNGFDRQKATSAYLYITDRPGEEVAKAASRVYEKLFTTPVGSVEMGPWQINRTWIH